MKKKKNLHSKNKATMSRSFKETYGPEFDDRLIQMVRKNPAIYDVNHPHYRRNQVRIGIWERIAYDLSAPSKFVQTKWKNIRYNYLQELKSIETGIINVNVRKRRFTEDLSFLQNTAQAYNMAKKPKTNHSTVGSDNDSNSYMYSDSLNATETYEVIEIEHSDEGSCPEDDDFFDILNGTAGLSTGKLSPKVSPVQELAGEAETTVDDMDPQIQMEKEETPLASSHSNRSSPLLTPLVMENGENEPNESKLQTAEVISNGLASLNDNNIEPTLTQPRPRAAIQKQTNNAIPRSNKSTPADIMKNAAQRKAMQAPFPVLTPINDPIELYCLSLVDSLRSMPRSERERVKYEFAKILKDAKYINES